MIAWGRHVQVKQSWKFGHQAGIGLSMVLCFQFVLMAGLWMPLITDSRAADRVDPDGERSEFVKVDGTNFVFGRGVYRIAGVNNHYLTFGSAAEVTRVLDDAVAMGANVVRTILQPVIGSISGSVPTIWDWKKDADASDLGVNGSYLLYWNDSQGEMAVNAGPNGFEKVDFLISEAHKRNLRLIISFLDFWAYTGGAQQIRAWYGGQDQYQFFFEDVRTRADYRKWVLYVVSHVNPLTHLAYRDDPTILGWDLMNEPVAQPKAVRDDWLTEMATYVKSVDPNHLVSSGMANVAGGLADITIPSIDFVSWHGYPRFYNLSVQQLGLLIKTFCALGAKYNKPVLLEEFGYPRSKGNQSVIYRDWLETIRQDYACAGWIVWRLVSLQDNGQYPIDNFDQFDVHNDGGATWQVLKEEAVKLLEAPGR
jgi:mannan endo-1,4-beta-mannosidase